MICPPDLSVDRPMKLDGGVMSTTTKVWEVQSASCDGDIERVRRLIDECPQLAYAQYNYAPPIHFAVREGHIKLVELLLGLGAHDPDYRFYPFQESLQTVADDRGYKEIVTLLDDYAAKPALHTYKGDNGEIDYLRTNIETEFEKAVYKGKHRRVEEMLNKHPDLARKESFFWGEGILLFAAKGNDRVMMDLLMSYGAKVPKILKWAQFYYFERFDAAQYLMERGMDPNTMSHQRVTLLHDMAHKGFIDKAELLITHGADLDPIDEAYKSTPLGLAARWGNTEMVRFLLDKGADPELSAAAWSTPLAWSRKKGHKEIEQMIPSAIAARKHPDL